MDTTDSPNPRLPARVPSPSSYRVPVPVIASAAPAGVSGGAQAGMAVNPKTLLRALLRHWWQILGLSLLISLPILYFIYAKIEPKFEAQALLEVKLTKPNLYGVSTGDTGEKRYVDNFLLVQLRSLKSGEVLGRAINDQEVMDLNSPLITQSKDPIGDLSKELVVQNIKDTFMIQVSLESRNAREAFVIVKAVINAYMVKVKEYSDATTNTLIKSLKDESDKLAKDIKDSTDKLLALTRKGTIQFTAKSSELRDSQNPNQTDGDVVANSVSEEHFAEVRKLYRSSMMELEAAERLLNRKLEDQDPTKQESHEDSESLIASAAIDKQIETEFVKDPEVVDIVQKIDDREHELKRVADIARLSNDPAVRNLKKHILELRKRYKQLWESKYEDIRGRVMTDLPSSPKSNESLAQLQAKVADLRAHTSTYEKALKDMKIENGEARIDAIRADIERDNLKSLQHSHTLIDSQLKQSTFEVSNQVIRVSISDPVRMPLVPSQDKRLKLMAIVPVGVMAAILGLFLLLEIKAERVSDPESLSMRVQSEVFALPPLPNAREVRRMRKQENGNDQIDRFIQRLDHLRFAVFGSQAAVGQGRCVLVTSAVGGEGKSTLAAQLAARCGSSGISTILIDADMRRSSLGSLLDLPEGAGLSDVLSGDISVEEAVIPVQGGTFHVLLAGTPIDDVSRILHGQNVGILIARLREIYDLVVIDSPPVLPVPDALVLGQWSDGAILASRFDISRFPQVERARKQLDAAGIPIVGTVINGMRSVDSYYGDYSYSRRQGQGSPSRPDDSIES